MISTTQITVRYAETDAMGIVHHSRYFPWLEVARTDFIKLLGHSYRTFEKDGYRLVVSRIDFTYRSGAVYDDEISIHTELIAVHRRGMTFRYNLLKGDLSIAEGTTEHLVVYPNGKISSFTKEWLELLKANSLF